MLEALKLFALAVLQGIAEFLPVSSSSHIALAGKWIGLEVPGIRVELALHIGTLVAVLLYYHARIAEVVSGVFKGEKMAWRYACAILVSCIPAIVAYYFFHDWVTEKLDGSFRFTGAMLVVTGLFLLSSRLARNISAKPLTSWRAFLIGIAQACAMVPGISRSGSTIVLARFLSVEKKEAVAFSFLMSAPLLIGGAILELLPSSEASMEACSIGWDLLLPAMVIAAVVGCLAIRLLMLVIERDWFWLFGFYCIPMGLFVFFAA